MYRDFDKLPDKTKEILGPYLKRWSPYILKIAMLLQIVDDPKSDRMQKTCNQWRQKHRGLRDQIDNLSF